MSNPSFERVFELESILLRTTTHDDFLNHAVCRSLTYKAYQPVSRDFPDLQRLCLEFHLQRRKNLPRVPKNASFLIRHMHELKLWKDSDNYFVDGHHIFASIDPRRKLSSIYLSPRGGADKEAEQRIFMAVSLGLAIMLKYNEYYALHSVALERRGSGVLLCGQSDCGKSTSALSLVKSGWSYISDDSILLRLTGDDVIRALSQRKVFCVDPEAAGIFPELERYTWDRQLNNPDKWMIDVSQLYPARDTDSCIPSAVIFPQIVDEPTSSLTQISKTDALGRLIRQSGFVLVPVPELTNRQVETLRRLLLQCHTYRLLAGRDLVEDTSRLSDLLDPVVRR